MQHPSLNSIFHNLLMFGFLSTLFGCGNDRPGLFSAFGYHVGKDKVWYKSSSGMAYNVDEVVGADPKTFAVRELRSNVNTGATAEVGMDAQSVFWAGKKIDAADPASFEYLCGTYAKDKHGAYSMTIKISEDLAHLSVVGYDFVKDSKHVYFGTRVFSEDPDHFVEISPAGSGYFKDSHQCWYGIYDLKDADPATLHVLGPKTAADATRIFQEMNEVDGADLKTYKILEDGYAKDARNVYLSAYKIEGAQPASFRLLGQNYSLDAGHCYYFSTPIQGADPATFQMVDRFYVKDARQVYCNGKVIEGADPATFRVLNGEAGCSCDDKHAYTLDKRIEGSNPKTFPAGKCKTCNESGVTF
jgi:hypothetical protein